MTKPLLFAACVLLGLPQAVCAQDRRAPSAPMGMPRMGPPSAATPLPDHLDAKSTVPLRESLRQSWQEADEKPYRLSSEERHRMREQLRAQAAGLEASSK
jgi:hypothetical protein